MPLSVSIIKKTDHIKFDKDVEELLFLRVADRRIKWHKHY